MVIQLVNPVINAAAAFFTIFMSLPEPFYSLVLWSWFLGIVAFTVNLFYRGKS